MGRQIVFSFCFSRVLLLLSAHSCSLYQCYRCCLNHEVLSDRTVILSFSLVRNLPPAILPCVPLATATHRSTDHIKSGRYNSITGQQLHMQKKSTPAAKRGCLFGIAHVVSLYTCSHTYSGNISFFSPHPPCSCPPERHIALAGIKE
jgi:hypothetical protein